MEQDPGSQDSIGWYKTKHLRVSSGLFCLIHCIDEDTGHGEGIEEELLSVGRGSFTSFHSSVFNHDNSLYLIR